VTHTTYFQKTTKDDMYQRNHGTIDALTLIQYPVLFGVI
jgi:hypothetical protein